MESLFPTSEHVYGEKFVRYLIEQGALFNEGFLQEIGALEYDEGGNSPKRRRTGELYADHYWSTPWGRLYRHPETMIPGTRRYRTFRQRFRGDVH